MGTLLGLTAYVGVGCQFPNYVVTAQEEGGGEAGGEAGVGPSMGGGASGDGVMGGSVGREPVGVSGTASTCEGSLTCAPALPAGWLGPVAFWKGRGGEEAPSCPEGFDGATDLHALPSGAPATCSCQCAAQGETCVGQTSIEFYKDQHCQPTTCAIASATSCTRVVGCDGQGGSIRAPIAGTAGGTCVATPDVQRLPARWEQDARLCTPSRGGASCGAEGGQCLPTPSQPFGSPLCVYRVALAGQSLPDCPAAYPNGREVLYDSLTDERTCSACQCAGPTGGSCGGKVSFGSGDACVAEREYELGTGCMEYLLSAKPSHASLAPVLTPGACVVTVEPEPLGSVTPSGTAHVVCCR
jgi:hypothetical protein